MLKIGHLYGFGSGTATPSTIAQSISYSTHALSTVNLSTYTFAATTVGSGATTDRLIVVSAGAAGPPSTFNLASATINSSAATIVVQGSTGQTCAAIFQMPLPTTEEAVDIGLTWSTTVNNTHVMVYILKGLVSATATTFGADANSTSFTASVALNRELNGVGVALLRGVGTGTAWTTPFAENLVSSIEAGSFSGASLSPASSGSVTAEIVTTTSFGKALVAALWA